VTTKLWQWDADRSGRVTGSNKQQEYLSDEINCLVTWMVQEDMMSVQDVQEILRFR